MISGGQVLMKALSAHDVARCFSVAGESYLPVLDAAINYPDIEMITCRQESGATFAAEAYGLLTGKPGIAFVTHAPGACNASIGVHAAKQSSAPMILFVGLVRREDRDKEAFQEFDLVQMFDSHTKWAAVIDDASRIGEYVSRAMHVAVSGRAGPVVLGLPEDILSEMVKNVALKPLTYLAPKPHGHDVKNLLNILGAAEKPLVIVGGSGWSDEACEDLASFASASHLPVAASFRRQDIVDHRGSHYVGDIGFGSNPKLLEAARAADVVLVLGARISEVLSQSYTLFSEGQTLLHVYPDADIFGQVYIPDYAVQADVNAFVAALAASRVDGRKWAGWRDSLRQNFVDWHDVAADGADWDGADMTQVFAQLRHVLPENAIVSTDAGNFSGWCNRYIQFGRTVKKGGRRLLAPLSGAMGYGIPAAISASLEYRDRCVLGICGDGGFMMTAMELATAMHHGAKPILMVCNNAMYGTIRMHQDRDFPERVSGTALSNPDFVKLAESHGALGLRISHADDFADVWAQALAADRLVVIEVVMDSRQMSTTSKL